MDRWTTRAAATALASLAVTGATAAAAHAADEPRVLSASQSEILSSRTIVVRLDAPAGARVTLGARLGGEPIARRVRLEAPAGGLSRAALALTRDGRRLLAACEPARLVVTARVRREGARKARRLSAGAPLRLDRAACAPPAGAGPGPGPGPVQTAPSTDPGPAPAGPPSSGGGSGQGAPYVPPPVDVSNADRCDFLVPSDCLHPFPNDRFTVADPSTPTGRRVALPAASMPRNAASVPIDPSDINRADGFSPGQPIVVHVPGLDSDQAMANTGAVPVTDLARTYDAQQPVVLINARTRQRQLIWAELDANATDPSDRHLLINPAVNLEHGERYIVALRHLRDADGDLLAPTNAFRVYRDSLPTFQPEVEQRRPHMESILSTLSQAGIERSSLYLAWDFTVASRESITGRMLSIRDRAFAELGDTDLSDLAVAGQSPTFDVTSVTSYTQAENAQWARRVQGTVTVPCFLDQVGCPPGSRFALDADGMPVRMPGNVTQAPFICNIPRVTMDGPSGMQGRPTMYGHGLFGSASQVNGPKRASLANIGGMVMCATDFKGMASDDQPGVVTQILPELSRFPRLADRIQQGLLNFLFLGRAMVHPSGFAAHPAFRVDKGNGSEPLIDTRRLFYTGVSEGGILGGSLTAVAPDLTRSVLVVPGMRYSVLLPRSVDYDNPQTQQDFAGIMAASYQDRGDHQLILSLLQLMWDRGEPNGYAHYMTDRALPNTPRHKVLLSAGFGDHQVANITAEAMARTIGAHVRMPALDPGRSTDAEPFYGIPPIPSFPFDGNGLVMWDIGPLRNGGAQGTPAAPTTNTPPTQGVDPHGPAGQEPPADQQTAAFLDLGGAIIDPCGASPCYAGGWTGP
ncbi:MAG TPA: hypothetical protein VIL49_04710 [Capillimicrobium sp.]|jgi:hypothetical protein